MKEKIGSIIILSSIFLLAWLWIESIISFKYIISIGYPLFKITAFIILLSISLAIILGIFINSFRQNNIKPLNTQVNKKDGFSLLEILLVITIIGVFSSLIVPVVNSLNSMIHLKGTKQKMEMIAAKVRQYYRSHEAFPDPGEPKKISSTTINSSVPVSSNTLELEQKYRLDEWGQYFYFIICYTTDTSTPPGYYSSAKKINGIFVNNTARDAGVAGVIISGGPNQIIDSFNTQTTTLTDQFPEPGAPYLGNQKDDIYVAINVSMEAKEIVIEKLKILENAKSSLDNYFSQKFSADPLAVTERCNDGTPLKGVQCPTNCGNKIKIFSPTLDHLEDGWYYLSCSTNFDNALNFLL